MIQPTHILSLGAGVQSSTMALMAAAGELDPMPAAAIFADTQDEPESVYRWLDWLEEQLPFPVHRVTRGKLSDNCLEHRTTKDGRAYAKTDVPFFTRNEDGAQGKIVNRACTRDFKIQPIMKEARKIAGVPRRKDGNIHVVQWIGISLDEVYRMKPSREWWAQSMWPLIDKRMTRHDCLLWMEARGYPKPPRSACVYCPFHSNATWRQMKDEEPEAFAQAVEFEKKMQEVKSRSENFKSQIFLHRSLVPLDQVDLSTDLDRGQLDMFNNECEGMCGL